LAIKFSPLGERVVVKPKDQEEQTTGGIYLPDTAKEKPQEGEIVAVGKGRVAENGTLVAMQLSVGDKVIYSKFAGLKHKAEDDEYLIMRESDILAKIA
jgi:chaperonin GroES